MKGNMLQEPRHTRQSLNKMWPFKSWAQEIETLTWSTSQIMTHVSMMSQVE